MTYVASSKTQSLSEFISSLDLFANLDLATNTGLLESPYTHNMYIIIQNEKCWTFGAFGENLSKVRSRCAADLAINISHDAFQRVHSGGHEGLWFVADFLVTPGNKLQQMNGVVYYTFVVV